VADAIGQRLARLAAKVQVLSVTHAPQVAARADAHFLISKSGVDRVSTMWSRWIVPPVRRKSPACSQARGDHRRGRAAAERLMREKA
jgi:DNA repair protein RecN (Recombination protein N)